MGPRLLCPRLRNNFTPSPSQFQVTRLPLCRSHLDSRLLMSMYNLHRGECLLQHNDVTPQHPCNPSLPLLLHRRRHILSPLVLLFNNSNLRYPAPASCNSHQ